MSRLNVLLYNGSGVSPSSRDQALTSLRSLLSDRYDVQLITPKSLRIDPWFTSCALLVFPGGRDLPYLHDLTGTTNARIREYVQAGGRYLGFCAGAYYACERVEFEVEGVPEMTVRGERELRFFKGVGKGTAFPGFAYDTEVGAREVIVGLERSVWKEHWPGLKGEDEEDEEMKVKVWYNGGGVFVPRLDATGLQGNEEDEMEVIGRYEELEGRPIAGVKCKVGDGVAVLWAVHPEHALSSSSPSTPSSSTIPIIDRAKEETRRRALLRATLAMLGLDVADLTPSTPALSPLFLTSLHLESVVDIFNTLQSKVKVGETNLVDRHDSFLVGPMSTAIPRLPSSPIFDADQLRQQIKYIVPCLNGLPTRNETRLFDVRQYFSHLGATKEVPAEGDRSNRFGGVLLYGEVMTSTQTILDKNITLQAALPSGLVCVASRQLSGRGRGGNTWLSPAGCLQFSLLLRMPSSHASKIVFVQYLFGLAVVEAIRSEPGFDQVGKRIRLKWPNDIYADMGVERGEEARWQKIGGILVNSSYAGSDFNLVIGCGINNTNALPTTCLSELVALQNSLSTLPPLEPLSHEQLLAVILKRFETMWTQFLEDGFEPFLDSYLEKWIHSNQIITISSGTTSPTQPAQKVRVVSITPDHGLLRTIRVDVDRNGREVFGGGGSHSKREYIDLQPDGNSFDMMRGLIQTKSN